MFVLQCALISICYYLGHIYSSFGGFLVGNYTLCRPLVGGFICGVILGDIPKGLEIGIAIQLAYMGSFAVGGSVAMDVGAVSYPVTAVAIISNLDVGTALAIGAPVSILAANMINVYRAVNTVFTERFKKAVDACDRKKMTFYDIICPALFLFTCCFIMSFVFIYFGAPVIETLVAQIPEKVIYALGLLAKVLPAVGMGLLLKYNITNKSMFIFFLFGFMLFAYMQMSFLAIAIFAVVIAYIFFYVDSNKAKVNNITIDDGEDL